MPLTVVVTSNAPGRVRGFLTSCACEIGPGIYTAPRMSQNVRERVWEVLTDWCTGIPSCTVLMTYPDPRRPGGQQVETIGLPRTQVYDYGGVYLTRRKLPIRPQRPNICREESKQP